MPAKPKSARNQKSSAQRAGSNVAFLLAQIGAHAASLFAGRLQELELVPPHAGILRMLSAQEGISQQQLCTQLSILPSRLVVLLDELEKRGLVERRSVPDDRRSYAIHLTDAGRTAVESIGRIAREHNSTIVSGLASDEAAMLGELLARVAETQGLTPGVHPGFSRAGSRKGKP